MTIESDTYSNLIFSILVKQILNQSLLFRMTLGFLQEHLLLRTYSTFLKIWNLGSFKDKIDVVRYHTKNNK